MDGKLSPGVRKGWCLAVLKSAGEHSSIRIVSVSIELNVIYNLIINNWRGIFYPLPFLAFALFLQIVNFLANSINSIWKFTEKQQQQKLKQNLFPVIEEKHFQHFLSFK